MSSNKKFSLSLIAMVLVATLSIVTIIAVFAAGTQSFSSNITVKYIASHIEGKVSAKYYVGPDDASGTAMTTTGKSDGAEEIEFRASDEQIVPNTLNPQSDIVLTIEDEHLGTKDKHFVVFEYKFQNGLGSPVDSDYTVTLTFNGPTSSNIKVTTAESESEPLKDFADITQPVANYKNFSVNSVVNHNPEADYTNVKYVYVRVEIDKKGSNSSFLGEFNINMAHKESYNGIKVNNSSLGEAVGYIENDKIAITATPKASATLVGVKNNSTGKWEDVKLSSSQADLEIDASTGEYTVVFNDNSHTSTTSTGGVSYTLLQDAQVAVAGSTSGISLTAVVEPTLKNTTLNIQGTAGGYPVVAVGANLASAANTIVVLPDSVLYVDENAFNLTGDNLIAISAKEELLNKINGKFKILLDNELDLSHYADNENIGGSSVLVTFTYNYKVSLSTASNADCFTLNYTGDLSASGQQDLGATYSATKKDKLLLIGSNVDAVYNLKISNDVYVDAKDGDLTQMTESENIKAGGSVLYSTPGGTKSYYTEINPSVTRSFDNAVANGQDISVAFWYNYSTDSNPCFVKGSLVTLANGKTIPVEDVTYDDLLLVWDFNTGSYGASYPVWITKTLKTEKYYEITFDDGSVFKAVVAHRLYSTDTNYFEKSVDAARSQVGHKFFAVNTDKDGNAILDADGNITFAEKTMVKIEIKTEETEYYNLITGYSMNVFVNSILSSTGMSNLYGATPGMKFDSASVESRLADMYDLSELNVPAHYYYGLRLGEQKTVREIEDINQYIKNDMDVAREVEQVELNGVSYNNWIVATSDDDVFSPDFKPTKVREGGTYTLAQPKNAENFVGWYCSADGKIYRAGDAVTIRMGTYFTALYN